MTVNPNDFDQLFEKNKDRVFRLIFGLIPRQAEAEDLTQQVFFRAFERLSDFREESQFFTWLHRIAINLATDYLRSATYRRERSLDQPAPDREESALADQLPDPSPSQEETYVENEHTRLVREALARINPNYQEVLVLRELLGHTHEEIAALLGLSMENVNIRLIRGRKALKKILGDNVFNI